MSKVFKIFLVLMLSFVFCMSFVYASDVTMDLPDSDSTSNSSEENSTDSNVTDDNSLADEYLNGAPEEENTALPEDFSLFQDRTPILYLRSLMQSAYSKLLLYSTLL